MNVSTRIKLAERDAGPGGSSRFGVQEKRLVVEWRGLDEIAR